MLLHFTCIQYKYDLDTFACRVSVLKKNFTYYFLPCPKHEAGHSVCNNTTQNPHTQHYNSEMICSIHNAASST
jgi:hypothetical protein